MTEAALMADIVVLREPLQPGPGISPLAVALSREWHRAAVAGESPRVNVGPMVTVDLAPIIARAKKGAKAARRRIRMTRKRRRGWA